MLSSAKIKYIRSLRHKKYREIENKFIVEGEKSMLEFLKSAFKINELFLTDDFISKHEKNLLGKSIEIQIAKRSDIERAGTFKSNNAGLAIVQLPKKNLPLLNKNEFFIAADGMNDPGNLGSIIRIADWYGISNIFMSENSSDCYNPKVVNASKGSLSRVRVNYCDLSDLLSTYSGEVFGAATTGDDIHKLSAKKGGIILVGSESHGISNYLKPLITKMVSIPGKGSAESLNVAVATAIICDNLLS